MPSESVPNLSGGLKRSTRSLSPPDVVLSSSGPDAWRTPRPGCQNLGLEGLSRHPMPA